MDRNMKKMKCFRLMKVFKWFTHRRTKSRTVHQRLSLTTRAMSKLCNWGNSLKLGARVRRLTKSYSDYTRVREELVDRKTKSVPKGHLAVYVGEKENDTCRVLVPVIYCNHPLFVKLLEAAEKVYGFDHAGGIQIPCRVSEFENVQTRIAAAGRDVNSPGRRRWRYTHQ